MPLSKIFLKQNGFSEQDFRYRLALGCLKTLVREISVSGGDEEMVEYRQRVLGILKDSLDLL